MNTTHRSTVASTLFATIVTALVLTATQSPVQAEPLRMAPVASTSSAVVHQLPRVVVTGHVQRPAATTIIELPRVVVTGRRVDADQTLLSQANARNASRS